MQAPRAEHLLRVWEDTRGAHPIHLALGLLDAAWPGRGEAGWAGLPIGVRDAHLLEIQQSWFGAAIETTTECASCGERLESSFDAMAIRVEPPPSARGAAPARVKLDGFEVEFRLPDSADLLAVATIDDPDRAQRTLLQRCVESIRATGLAPAPTELPPTLVPPLGVAMSRLDPGAELELELRCPACGREQRRAFDIVTYLRDEVDDWAQRMLADIHLLARAYGWGEREILALSTARRQHYVQMVCA